MSSMQPPKVSPEERRAALHKALEMRRLRAEFKRMLKEGKVATEEVLGGTPDDVVGRMRVSAFLESLPGVSRVRSRRIMKRIGISSSRRVQGLGERQRRLILEELESSPPAIACGSANPPANA